MKYTLVVLMLFLPIEVLACSCIGGELPLKKAIKQSDFIISGTIIRKVKIEVHPESDTSINILVAKYTVLINHRFKGKYRKDTMEVITGWGNGDCGFEFQTGKSYIIYAIKRSKLFGTDSKKLPHIYTDICMRTKEEDDIEFKKLKRGR